MRKFLIASVAIAAYAVCVAPSPALAGSTETMVSGKSDSRVCYPIEPILTSEGWNAPPSVIAEPGWPFGDPMPGGGTGGRPPHPPGYSSTG